MKEPSLIEAFDDVVAKIASSVSRNIPEADADDVSQHLYLTILEKRQHFKSPDAPGVTNALWRIAKDYATKIRTEALHLNVQYSYTTDDIRSILEHTFDQSEWPDTKVPEDAKSLKSSADQLDIQSDIKWAWSQLSVEDKRVVFKRYGLKEDLPEAARKRCNRAIDKLASIINTYPRPGHPRRAMTNSRAQHIIGGSYE